MMLLQSASFKKVFFGVMVIGLVSLATTAAYSQLDAPKNRYWFSSYEFIFSLSEIGAPDSLPSDIYSSSSMRFSGFFNTQYQYHYDINKNFGLMTGFGVRNVGFINNILDSIKLKQRVYSFGVPVAMKFGKLPGGYSVTLGIEPELFFHYKQKAIYDDEKYKKMGWFSNRVNLINPSVFLDLRFKNGFFLRYKHYLLDVLVPENQSVSIGEKSVVYVPESSKMFYLSFGFSLPMDDEKNDRKRPNNDIFGFKR